MNVFGAMMYPRATIGRYKSYHVAGRSICDLESIPFHSGLQDSAWLLHGLTRSLKPEVCVEIGSARGKSACFVGRALAENGKGKLYAIDPHMPTSWNDENSVDTFGILSANLERLGLISYVEIIRKTSAEAVEGWDRKIDLLFIDGDHTYEGVKTDWDLFMPFVSEFGIVVFHDTIWAIKAASGEQAIRDDMGVPRFVEELRRTGYPVITLPHDCGVSLVQPRSGGIPLEQSAAQMASVT